MPSEPVAWTWAPDDDRRNFTEDTPEPQAYEERSFTEYGKTRRRQPGAYPVQNAARKCTFCSHLLEQAILPACITTCIGGAMYFGGGNDPSILVNEVTLG
ncbi:MAG: 4Fe-4S dicluster domain-containing protein [Bryobacteraceae bacterium]